jgi:hypothetical protein
MPLSRKLAFRILAAAGHAIILLKTLLMQFSFREIVSRNFWILLCYAAFEKTDISLLGRYTAY